MSRKQVMEHFGIGKTTLHRWTNVEGKLKSFPIGGRKFFKLDDVENMIESYYSESNNLHTIIEWILLVGKRVRLFFGLTLFLFYRE